MPITTCFIKLTFLLDIPLQLELLQLLFLIASVAFALE